MTNYDFFVISTVTPQEISPEPTPRTSQKIWFVVVDDGNTYYPVKMCLANGDKWGDPVDIDASANNGNTNLSITNRGANTLDIASDTGDDATIPAATTTQAGLQSAEDKTKLDGIEPGAQVNTVNSVAGKTGAVTLTKSDVGLTNVDNTSDADKPISTATQTALNGKQNANTKLTAIAGLTGATPIRSDGTNGALTAAEIPNLDASKITGTFADNQIPATIARDTEVTAAVTAHEGAADPHPQYLTATEGNAAYQPLDPDLTAIAALTTPGLVDRTGPGTATARTTGTTGLQVLAAVDQAAVRTAAGLGSIATQNSNAVNITGGATKGLTDVESDIFTNISGQAVLRMLGDTFGGAELRLENRPGSNGAVFRNNDLALVDFRFEAAGTTNTINMRTEFRAGLDWGLGPGNCVQFFRNSDSVNSRLFGVGATKSIYYVPIEVGSASAITTIGQGTIRVGTNAGAISGTESVTTTLSSPGAGWSFSWARAQVGDEIRISPTNGSTVAITGRCATAGTVLADTSAWTAGLQIQLRIIRMTA